MSSIKKLIKSYGEFIRIPWKNDLAASERVIICIYDQKDERRLRYRFDEFGIETRKADHKWSAFDLSGTFAAWLTQNRYAEKYFERPMLLNSVIEKKYLDYLTGTFKEFLCQNEVSNDAVVALYGVGTLFGLLKVKAVAEAFAPFVPGRLVIFFPGSYENKNYRLLDAYDGWDYHAVPITGDDDF